MVASQTARYDAFYQSTANDRGLFFYVLDHNGQSRPDGHQAGK
jgi:hypothetical protein